MADTKISALTSATTPLAGTEVLPIVQSSTTKKVTVSDLTAGRAISANGISSTDVIQYVRTDTNAAGVLFGNSNNSAWVGVENASGSYFGAAANAAVSVTAPGYKWQVVSGGFPYLELDLDRNFSVTTGNFVFGTAGKGIQFAGNSNVLWRCGSGSPESVVTAPIGSLYTRTDGGAGTTLYVKESGSGNTGWVAK